MATRGKAKKQRQYFRKCGICGSRHEQSEMVRDAGSPSGYLCIDCHMAEYPERYMDMW